MRVPTRIVMAIRVERYSSMARASQGASAVAYSAEMWL